jgi:NAD(P)-dependent dehydrogenase (short-subunit alcohol dehydrogenase family)
LEDFVTDIDQGPDPLATAASIAGPLLADQTIILTGAAGGIGRTVSRALVDAAATPILVDRPGERLEELRELLEDTTAAVHEVDVTDRAAVRQLVAEVERDHGRVDGLVNCAGLWEISPWEEIDDRAWNEILDANLRSAFLCCQAVLPGMVRRRGGAIVNFASTAGEYGSISPAAHYAAAKAGVIGLTKSLAREVGSAGVRVNAISPGPTDTLALGAINEEEKARVGARTLLGRLGEPEEMANAVLYLVGPMSTFVTGHVLRVNGGALL